MADHPTGPGRERDAEPCRRPLRIVPLGNLRQEAFPAFVKPLTPKQFKSAVFALAEDLAVETQGLGPEVEVIVSEVVTFLAEARAFVLDAVAN